MHAKALQKLVIVQSMCESCSVIDPQSSGCRVGRGPAAGRAQQEARAAAAAAAKAAGHHKEADVQALVEVSFQEPPSADCKSPIPGIHFFCEFVCLPDLAVVKAHTQCLAEAPQPSQAHHPIQAHLSSVW